MSVIIRLQGLPWSASAGDIRTFFHGLNIPDGGVHIVGGERGDAFIAFTSDEDARLAMQCNNAYLKDSPVQLFLSSKTEMQNVIAEARDGHAPRPAVIQPPYSNAPTVSGRPTDDYSRPDVGGRRVAQAPQFGAMGHVEDVHPPPDPRGMRVGIRQPPDTSPAIIGRPDDQYQVPDSFPRGGRDNRNAPNMYPPDPRGREIDRPEFPSRFPQEDIHSSQVFPPRPLLSRDDPLDPHLSRETVDPNRPPLGSDMRHQRPLSDVSPGSKGYRDEPRRGSERRSFGDRGYREENRSMRDEHRRSSEQPLADSSEPGSRSSRDRSRRSEENPDHSRSTSRSSKEGRYGPDSSRDTRQDSDRDRRDRDSRDTRRDTRKDNPDLRRGSSRHDDTSRSDTHGRDTDRSDIGRIDGRRAMDRSETGRPDLARHDTRRHPMGRPDMGRPDLGRQDVSRPDSARSDMGKLDVGRMGLGRPDLGRRDVNRHEPGVDSLGRPEIGRPDVNRPDMRRLDMGRGETLETDRPDMEKADINRPSMNRPEINRPDMGRPDMGRSGMNRFDGGRPDIGRPDIGRSDMGRADIRRPGMGRPDMARPEMGRPDMARPEMGRPDMARPEMGRPDMARPEMGRPEMTRPDMGRPDMGRPDMTRPDMSRPDMTRIDLSRPGMGRPGMARPDMARLDMGRPDRDRLDLGRPNTERPDIEQDYQRYPPEFSGSDRHGHMDNEAPIRPENQGLRNGPRQAPGMSHANLNNFGDQDRRGPPPRFPDERGPPPDKFPPGERGPPIPNQRVGPDHDRGRMKPGFPRDQDIRVAPMFIKHPEGPGPLLPQPSLNLPEGIHTQGPGERFPVSSQQRPSDWDNRGPRDRPLPPSLMDTNFLPPSKESNTLAPDQSRDESFLPPRARTLLPDPNIPRIDSNLDRDTRDNSFNRSMEYDGYAPRDGRGIRNGFRESADMRERRLSPQHGPYPPRGPPGDLPMPLRRPPGPPGPPEFYIKVRNMPLNITYSSLRRFFGSLFIPRDGIKLINDNQGNRNGLGFVKMVSGREFDIALNFNGRMMEDRRAIISPCSFEEFNDAIDSYPCAGRPLSPKRHMVDSDMGHSSPKRKRSEPPSESQNRFVIMLRDVAYRATVQDLKKYFENLNIAQNGRAIIADQDSSGKANGIVFVELTNPNDFNAALQRNYGRILGRVVYVSAADPKDIDRVREKIEKRKKATEVKKPAENVGGGDNTGVSSNNRGSVKDADDRAVEVKNANSKPQVKSDPPKVENKQNQNSAKPNDVKSNTVKPPPAKPNTVKSPPVKPPQIKQNPVKQDPVKQDPVKQDSVKQDSVKQDPGSSCVKVNGLPSGVTKKDVEEFFKGLEISPKGYNPVLRKDGTCTGDAFVEFVNSNDCQKASAQNQQMMKDKKVSVKIVSRTTMETELEELHKKALEEGQNAQYNRPPPLYFMLGAQNLPFTVSIGEILNFFRGYNPVPESIRLHYNNEGRATGDAVIGFMTESECHRALRDLNSRMLGRRNIRLFLA